MREKFRKTLLTAIAMLTMLGNFTSMMTTVSAEEDTGSATTETDDTLETGDTTNDDSSETTDTELDPVSQWSNTDNSDVYGGATEITGEGSDDTSDDVQNSQATTDDDGVTEVTLPDSDSYVTMDRDKWLTIFPNGSETESIQRNIYKTEAEVLATSDVLRIDDEANDYKMYAWDNDGTIFWWSDAEYVYVPENATSLFADHAKLTDFDFTAFKLDKVKYPTDIFKGCTSLDLTIKDTSFMAFVSSDTTCYTKTQFEVNSLTFENTTISDWLYLMGYVWKSVNNLTYDNIKLFGSGALNKKNSVLSWTDAQTPIYQCKEGLNLTLKNLGTDDVAFYGYSLSSSLKNVTIENCHLTQAIGGSGKITMSNVTIDQVFHSSGATSVKFDGVTFKNSTNSTGSFIIYLSKDTTTAHNVYLDNCNISSTVTLSDGNLSNFYARNSKINKLIFSSVGNSDFPGTFDVTNSTIKGFSGSFFQFSYLIFRYANVYFEKADSFNFQSSNLKTVDFSYAALLQTNGTINMNTLFTNSENLEFVNFNHTKFAICSQIDAQYIFSGCTSLKYLDFSTIEIVKYTDKTYTTYETITDKSSTCIQPSVKGALKNCNLEYLNLSNGYKAMVSTSNSGLSFSSIKYLKLQDCPEFSGDGVFSGYGIINIIDVQNSSFIPYSSSSSVNNYDASNMFYCRKNAVLANGADFQGDTCDKYLLSKIEYNNISFFDFSGTTGNYNGFTENITKFSNSNDSSLKLHNILDFSGVSPSAITYGFIKLGTNLNGVDYLKMPTFSITDASMTSTSGSSLSWNFDGFTGVLDLSNQNVPIAFSKMTNTSGITGVITNKAVGVPTWNDTWYKYDAESNEWVTVTSSDAIEEDTFLCIKPDKNITKGDNVDDFLHAVSDAKNTKKANLTNEINTITDSYARNIGTYYNSILSYNGITSQENQLWNYNINLVVTNNGQKVSSYGKYTFVIKNNNGTVVGTTSDYNIYLEGTSSKYTVELLDYPEKEGMKATVTSSQSGNNLYVYLDYSEYTSVTATKQWNDEGLESERPEYVTANLYKNGELIKSHKLTADNNWTYTWEGLLKSEAKDGTVTQNTYAIKEIVPEGYTEKYEEESSNKAYIFDSKEKVDIKVAKRWEVYINNELLIYNTNKVSDYIYYYEYELKFSKIATIKLLADGNVIKTATLEFNDYSRKDSTLYFYDLPKYNSDGTEIKYSIEEDSMPNCTTEIENVTTYDFEVINTFKYATKNDYSKDNKYAYVKINKIWKGNAAYVNSNEEYSGRISCYGQSITIDNKNASTVSINNENVYFQSGAVKVDWNTIENYQNNYGINDIVKETCYGKNSYKFVPTIVQNSILEFTVTNEYTEEDYLRTITVTKSYDGENSAYENGHPSSIHVVLKTNHGNIDLGTMSTPDMENNTATFQIPMYYDAANKIPYVVQGITEYYVKDYTLTTENSYSDDCNATFGFDTFTMTNKYIPEEDTEITIKKIWEGDEGQEDLRDTVMFFSGHSKIENEETINDYAEQVGFVVNDDGKEYTYTDSSTGETKTMKKMEKVSDNEYQIKYKYARYCEQDDTSLKRKFSIIEAATADSKQYYKLTKTVYYKDGVALSQKKIDNGAEFDTVEFTNTLVSTTYTANKVWNVANESEKQEITVGLYDSNGELYDSQVLNADNGWTYTWSNIAGNNNYKMKEISTFENCIQTSSSETVEDSDNGTHKTTTATFTNTPSTTISITKTWDDLSNVDGTRKNATVSIYANGDTSSAVKTITIPKSSDTYTTTIELPKYKDGQLIEYSVEETDVPDGYESTIEGNVTDGYNITNYHRPPENRTITVGKQWSDNNNASNTRPSSVEFKVYANGEDTGKTITLTEENGWKASDNENFPFLDESNQAITYTLEEVSVSGYTSSITGNMSTGFVCTNTLKDGIVSLWNQVVTIINTPKTYNVDIAKQVAGMNADKDQYFAFDVSISNSKANGEITFNLDNASLTTGKNDNPLTYTLDENGEGSFTVYVKHGEKLSIEGLQRHSKVTVTEQKARYYQTSHDTTYKDETTSSDSRTETIEDMYDDATIAYLNTIPYVLSVSEEFEETTNLPNFNNVDSATLTVNKQVTGSLGNKTESFNFQIQLPTSFANQKILYAKSGDTATTAATVDENGKLAFTLSHDEYIRFYGFTEDEISEIKEYENYGVAEASQVLKGYTTTYEGKATEAGNLELTVTNCKDGSVPTGADIASNAILFLSIGSILGLAFCLWKKKSKRSE